ncbi:hypothetical protein C5F50_02210 [Nitrosopumilus ureiphilus]|uniref:Uncharacterized protein n=1 Tax=Nitrosopumilus ureiphilus TaxID=1470067 RepID=A0A7D5RAF0_9ARCH|nr:hypothetical protein C5F50_02210 [Nitrosopumilus ureiphilus]
MKQKVILQNESSNYFSEHQNFKQKNWFSSVCIMIKNKITFEQITDALNSLKSERIKVNHLCPSRAHQNFSRSFDSLIPIPIWLELFWK